jgi:transposase InsO family protein
VDASPCASTFVDRARPRSRVKGGVAVRSRFLRLRLRIPDVLPAGVDRLGRLFLVWLVEYNELRPHRGLGMMTPAAFAASRNEGPK